MARLRPLTALFLAIAAVFNVVAWVAGRDLLNLIAAVCLAGACAIMVYQLRRRR